MKDEHIFKKIIDKKISSEIVYQDNKVTAFKDIKPKAPVHILVIPNIFIESSDKVNEKNKDYFLHMFYIATKIAKKLNINKSGYRLILNCNKNAGQEIKYVHLHILGGKKLSPITS